MYEVNDLIDVDELNWKILRAEREDETFNAQAKRMEI